MPLVVARYRFSSRVLVDQGPARTRLIGTGRSGKTPDCAGVVQLQQGGKIGSDDIASSVDGTRAADIARSEDAQGLCAIAPSHDGLRIRGSDLDGVGKGIGVTGDAGRSVVTDLLVIETEDVTELVQDEASKAGPRCIICVPVSAEAHQQARRVVGRLNHSLRCD